MSKAVKKSPQTESRDDIDDMISSEISSRLSMDDYVWIENDLSEATACEDLLESSTDTDIVNIAQLCTNTESSRNADENLSEYDLDDIEKPSEWEKEVLVDQQYWEQNGAVTQRVTSSRIKYPASQRLTIRQLNNIANSKTFVRDPSYFKFDSSTTATLETLIAKKYVGSLHNIVSKGKNSIVIHADCPETGVVRTTFGGGNAKVYKLSRDVKKNAVLLKRAQREYEHLLLLRWYYHGPHVVHKMKNVLIFGFVGDNQETAPSINKLPLEHMNRVYQIIVNDMDMWYTKCNIVHGNLCTKNILFIDVHQYYPENPVILYVMGWGHSIKRDHPRALIKLMRDCYFVTNFFRSRDVPVKSTEELFKHITGFDKISSRVLDAIHKKDLWQDGHLTNPNRY